LAAKGRKGHKQASAGKVKFREDFQRGLPAFSAPFCGQQLLFARVVCALLGAMKFVPLFLCALLLLFFVAGCADEPSAPKNDSRIGGSMGVGISSHDMSRVAPSRPNGMPSN
jgi:hypothetical protein